MTTSSPKPAPKPPSQVQPSPPLIPPLHDPLLNSPGQPGHQPAIPQGITALPIPNLPEITAGTDLADLLTAHLAPPPIGHAPHRSPLAIRNGDILCISTKIVSKSLGLTASRHSYTDVLAHATDSIVARRIGGTKVTTVVRSQAGPVMAAAGIDASNAPEGQIVILPDNADAHAHTIRAALEKSTGVRMGVLLTDTVSRPWRFGVADIALGASGLTVLEDLRGTPDRTGRQLNVTVRAVADEICAACDLARTKSNGVPVVIVRGLAHLVDGQEHSARLLNRTDGTDWFPYASLESVWVALGIDLACVEPASVDPEPDDVRRRRAINIAIGSAEYPPETTRFVTGTGIEVELHGSRIALTPPSSIDPGTSAGVALLLEMGALAERLRVALRAENLPPHVELQRPDPVSSS
ncbi:coenzyme F420-0:L-glutamate ligase [Devriesea agamarum]|uniref:coenzyme F420-0:L-glutamate ligase n=1 Tax=Devriesea agamarum TaxID=472569 RepID=UPI00071CCD13|nr:coenzyme F420-0:L-glutamate ligase [Devriesea agamarum]